MAFAYCPDCAGRLYLGKKPWVGQPVSCDRCDADLEVTQVNPLMLDWSDHLPDEAMQAWAPASEGWERDWRLYRQTA
jgi:lysine biosynthesis protein LysW